jgi:hypothetical protein
MRHVVQKTKKDCGVAALAMLARVPYKCARETLFPDGKIVGTWPDDMRQALVALDRAPATRRTPLRAARMEDRLSRIESLDKDALILTNEGKKESHWIVWDACQRKIRDPLKKPYLRRNLKPKYYITVE